MMERIIVNNYDEFMNSLLEFKPSFSLDTETTSLRYDELELEMFSLCDGNKAICVTKIDKQILDELKLLIQNAKTIIFHNAVYDMKVLYKYGIDCNGKKIYDTMIADHLLDENRSHSLKSLAKEILNKEEILSYKQAKEIGGDTFIEYATNDAIWTFELCMWQQQPLINQGMVDLFRNIEMPFQFVLLEMEINGVNVDKKRLDEYKIKLTQEVEDLEVKMHECINEPYSVQIDLSGKGSIVSSINFNSTQQLADIIQNRLGLTITEFTATGKPAVGVKTITKLSDQHEFMQYLKKYKAIRKLLNSFFEPMPEFIQNDGVIRANFHDIGTRTGRLSSSKPNLQQLPKDNKEIGVSVRECFTVPDGYRMIAADYSGQELRVLTEITQEPVLIDTFNKGKDMHLSTANDFFNLNIPEEDLYENSPNLEKWKEKYKDDRNKAKIINFGMAYGKGAYGFSQDFGISEEEAQGILDKYFAALPKVRQSIDNCHAIVRTHGYATNLAGRRRHFQKIKRVNDDGSVWEGYPRKAYRESFNFLIQGYSADMIRMAMVKVFHEAKKHQEWDLKTIITIHDESVYKVKEEYEEQAIKLIKDCFETAVKFCIPVVADVHAGSDYSEAK